MKVLQNVKMRWNRRRAYAIVAGIKIPVDRTLLSPALEATLAKGTYELKEARAAHKLVESGETILELGAGLGFISSYLRLNTKAGRIICVEAMPMLRPVIAETHRRNNVENVEVLSGVVYANACTATVPFYCRPDFWASSLDPEPGPVSSICEVPVMTLADVCARYNPSVLIADIEGGERELVRASSLGSIKKILLEVHPEVYGAGGVDEINTDLARLGFQQDHQLSAGRIAVFRKSS